MQKDKIKPHHTSRYRQLLKVGFDYSISICISYGSGSVSAEFLLDACFSCFCRKVDLCQRFTQLQQVGDKPPAAILALLMHPPLMSDGDDLLEKSGFCQQKLAGFATELAWRIGLPEDIHPLFLLLFAPAQPRCLRFREKPLGGFGLPKLLF